jgi:GNAT superfamily N-acetyltransferase
MSRIERLDVSRHDRSMFDCGASSLNNFLRQYARQFQDRNIGVTWVAVADHDPTSVLGYYTLAAGALIPDDLPKERVALPQIPIMLLGRLAVDLQAQGRGLGRLLLLHALHHAMYFSSHVGVYAVVVDALDERALEFYQQYGFHTIPSHPFRLYLSMREIANLPWNTL